MTRDVSLLIVARVAMSAVRALFGVIVPIYLAQIGFGATGLGELFGVVALTSAILSAGIARRLGLVRAIVISRVISAVLIVAMVLAPTFWIAGVIYLIRMLAQRVSCPLRQSYVMAMAPAEERASVGALSNLPAQGGSAVTPVAAGYLFAHVAMALPFEIASVLQTVNGILYYAFFRNLPPPEEPAKHLVPQATAPLTRSSGRLDTPVPPD